MQASTSSPSKTLRNYLFQKIMTDQKRVTLQPKPLEVLPPSMLQSINDHHKLHINKSLHLKKLKNYPHIHPNFL